MMAKVKTTVRSKEQSSFLDNKRKNKTLSKKQSFKTGKGKSKLQNKKKRDSTGVVYLSHIPHGFYEEEIEAYFNQFGKVTNVSVPRSKTGRPKGYAFIEYRHPEIAKIAAETMDNYLMFNRLLKAKYIPPEQQKPLLFFKARVAREEHRTPADKAELAVKHNRKLKNRHLKLGLEAKLAAKLLKKKKAWVKRSKKLGVSHDFLVQEADINSIFEKNKGLNNLKYGRSNKEGEKKGEGSDSESTDDTQTLESDGSRSEDSEEDSFSSESEEENYKEKVSNAKKVSKDILKNVSKLKKIKKPNKHSVSIPAPPKSVSALKSVKSQKIITPSKVKSTVTQVTAEVDFNDEKNYLKTSSNLIKQSIKTRKSSTSKTLSEESNGLSSSTKQKQNSSKKTSKLVKSPDKVSSLSPATSPKGKKLRHRQLKRLLNS